ncbi:hypothetical protein [Nonomuraea soli]|uniref:Uncharacterized protein n=1 Tax=Nonomuraea soli TaxID=1032476 RepID=A0A7W0HSZ4_9ACTN|nr:hypothetical protein [Nonomuraea soli]MBA2894442.1 hypothetical protein [Nonomuraea soli]
MRDVRWNVQWWAALTSVVAGFMSIPALIISLNALRISEQQHTDARRQQSASELLARQTFIRRVIINGEPGQAMVFGGDITVVNYNLIPVLVRLYAETEVTPTSGSSTPPPKSDASGFVIPPCAEVTLRIPPYEAIYPDPADRPSRQEVEIISHTAVLNPLDGRLWAVPDISSAALEASPLDKDATELMESIGWTVKSELATTRSLPHCA